jgi:uncharacterized protein (TIGR02996 family)
VTKARPELTALIEQVRANPQDIQTRLVLADWWEEQGNPQGTLINLHHHRSLLVRWDDGYRELDRRVKELEQQLRQRYCRFEGIHDIEFAHGCLVGISIATAGFQTTPSTLLGNQLDLVSTLSCSVDQLPLLPSSGWEQIKHLKLQGSSSVRNPALIATLVESPGIQPLALDSLNVAGCSLHPSDVKKLGSSACMEHLTTLIINHNQLKDEGIRELNHAPYLQNLNALDVSQNAIGFDGVHYLSHAQRYRSLVNLAISTNRFEIDALQDLARSTTLRRLKTLTLNASGIDDSGILTLAQSRIMGSLSALNLYANKITHFGVRHLAESEYIRKLTSLNLGCNRLEDRGVKALCTSPAFRHLEVLNLYGNNLTEMGIRALIESPHLHNIKFLDMRSNQIGGPLRQRLKSAPHFKDTKVVW